MLGKICVNDEAGQKDRKTKALLNGLLAVSMLRRGRNGFTSKIGLHQICLSKIYQTLGSFWTLEIKPPKRFSDSLKRGEDIQDTEVRVCFQQTQSDVWVALSLLCLSFERTHRYIY